MELMPLELAEFKFGDAAIQVRTRASVGDKLAVDKLVQQAMRSGSIDAMPDLGRAMVRLFVHGWTGVTLGGKPAPYSYELLEGGLPAALADDFMPALCKFVATNVDILKQPA